MMKGRTLAIMGGVLLYAVLGFFLAEYIAGAAYFLVNKSTPTNITLDTWWQYWHGYSADPVQRKRLQMAAGVAAFLVYGIPLMIISAMGGKRRSLHGDARWATAAEIREAGLL